MSKKVAVEKVGHTQCSHIYRSGQLHPSIKIGGGASLGRCLSDVFPGLLFCFEHATKDALAHLVRRDMHDPDWQGVASRLAMDLYGLRWKKRLAEVADQYRPRATVGKSKPSTPRRRKSL